MDHASAAAAAPGTAGGSERLTALSDGVFAIAMTLLVLDVSVPPGLGPAGFHEALHQNVPNLLAYVLSFAVISQFWWDHRRILATLPTTDFGVTCLTLTGLGLIALMPFPTSLLAEYGGEPLAVAVYSGGVAVTNLAHVALLLVSHRLQRRGGLPVDRKAQRLDVADLASTVVIFGAAAPLAFVSPGLAKLVWILLIPAKMLIGRSQRRAARAGHGAA
ncbi:TMEM175 family protein [Streptomyces sp. bgisy100]|uniref:TMEM175 family protein n=1 Tax=Streptomyces sp. bgisy100 TaxID=3413783 RepID=UPI003D74E844